MPATTFTPAAVAKRLDVHPNSVRAWCSEWAEFLDAGANPPSGTPRTLTLRDVAVFQVVMDGRKDGLTREQIAEQLRVSPPVASAQPYIEAAAPSSPAPAPLALPPNPDITAQLVDLAAALRSQQADTASRIERVEQRTGQLVMVVAVGAVLAFALGGLFVLLILRLGG